MVSHLTQSQAQVVRDKHRFRVVNCGRRFGKTTLAILEIVGKAVSADDQKIAFIANCYDDATEILTDGGWKKFGELNRNEYVATRQNGLCGFERPKKYYEYNYDGEMVRIKNNGIDALITPNHRCLVKNHRIGDWVIKTAEDIFGTWTYRFLKTADGFSGVQYDKNLARFWGWYVSEGYAISGKKIGDRIVITQKKEQFLDDIRATLNACSLPFREVVKNGDTIDFIVSGQKELIKQCHLLGRSKNKFVFPEIKNADKESIINFLEAYWNGDGHYPKDSYDYRRAETQSRQLADDLQELIIKIGGSATVRKISGRDLYSVSWLNKKFNEPLIRKGDYSKEKYKGKIYCVETESGIVMVRRNGKHYWCGNTYQQARDIAWRELKKLALPITINVNEARLEIEVRTNKGGTSLIWLRGWESVDTLRGQGFHFIILDEVASMKNFWENWHEVLRPTLSDTKGEALFLSTPKGYNHFYDLYELYKTDNDFKSFHFTSYDNTFLDPTELDKAKLELSGDRFAQEYMADFRKTEGLVYPEFSREIHLTDVVPQFRTERILGIDFGYTNPAAIYNIDIDQEGNYWITQEYYKTGKVNIELIEYAKSQLPNAVYPDPAEPDRCEEMKRHGLNVREVSKDVGAGIEKVRQLLRENKIKIHKSCVNLISEIETYRYPDKKNDKNYDENPIKDDDHGMDAIRYALFMHSAKGGSRHIVKQWSPAIVK